MSTAATLLVLTNLPDRETAERVAQSLVEQRIAACVNILAECSSIYRWQGKIETAREVPVFIKVTADRYPALEQLLHELHPYDVPEIIALPVTQGLPDYLQWVSDQTRMEPL